MAEIKSLSFRYGESTGKRAWYRVEDDERDICVRIETYDEKEEAFFAETDHEFLEKLAQAVTDAAIPDWNGFYDIEACLCDGDSWVLHIFYRDGQEIHAMGHSARPEGFEKGKMAMEDCFRQFQI